jgi:hypothetical protein
VIDLAEDSAATPLEHKEQSGDGKDAEEKQWPNESDRQSAGLAVIPGEDRSIRVGLYRCIACEIDSEEAPVLEDLDGDHLAAIKMDGFAACCLV